MIRRILALLGGEGFGSNQFPISLLIRHFIIQKIFMLNRSVPWPVHWTSRVMVPKKISRGSRCPGLSHGCHIDGRNGIVFGDNVWVGPRVSIISMNHDANDYHQYLSSPPVKIGDNCWLGANSVILPGVEIGNHTVVAAGSVVTKSFSDSDQMIAGVPAKVVKRLPPYGKKNDR